MLKSKCCVCAVYGVLKSKCCVCAVSGPTARAPPPEEICDLQPLRSWGGARQKVSFDTFGVRLGRKQ